MHIDIESTYSVSYLSVFVLLAVGKGRLADKLMQDKFVEGMLVAGEGMPVAG